MHQNVGCYSCIRQLFRGADWPLMLNANQKLAIGCCIDMKPHSTVTNTILKVAAERGAEKSTCPSEIARMLFPDDWREHMQMVVELAVELQRQGKVLITQKGVPVDVSKIKGPIRIKIS